MKLKNFVERYCSSIDEVTVRLWPREISETIWAEVELGPGMGEYPERMSRPALTQYRMLALADVVCVAGAERRHQILLTATMDTAQLVLLAGRIKAGQLPGKIWTEKGGVEK